MLEEGAEHRRSIAHSLELKSCRCHLPCQALRHLLPRTEKTSERHSNSYLRRRCTCHHYSCAQFGRVYLHSAGVRATERREQGGQGRRTEGPFSRMRPLSSSITTLSLRTRSHSQVSRRVCARRVPPVADEGAEDAFGRRRPTSIPANTLRNSGGCWTTAASCAHSSRMLGFNFMSLYKVPIMTPTEPGDDSGDKTSRKQRGDKMQTTKDGTTFLNVQNSGAAKQ